MKTLDEVIKNNAALFGVDEILIKCVIIQEARSQVDLVKNGLREINSFAIRHEPKYTEKYIPKSLSNYKGYIPTTVIEEKEKYLRSCSWGCMQILGQTAREQGFSCESLYQLLDIELNIYYGVKYLSYLLVLKQGNILRAIDNYNGGGNPNYKFEVMEIMKNKEYLNYNWSIVI